MTSMQTSAEFSPEKQELERVLNSGIFHRAPNLALLLTYVCSKHFEGTAEQIKEYNIAVDALGRPPDFDQKRDSIVRVEAHRLRKRLREYYEAEGADHDVHIDIPPGQYAPLFHLKGSPAEESANPAVEVPDRASLPQQEPALLSEVAPHGASAAAVPAVKGSRITLFALALLLIFCTGGVALWKAPVRKTLLGTAAAATVTPLTAGSDEIRILAGHLGADYTDRLGHVWRSDRYFQGGTVFETVDHPIFGTREPRIYQSRREGAFEYTIPLAAGAYELRLHFAETLYGENNLAGGGEASRVFNVLINGKEVLHEFDVINEAGASTADVRAFKDVTPGPDGKVHIKFEPFSNPPILCAIEITPGIAGAFRPIRMIALDRPYTDKQGHVWEPDRYARGGQLVLRTKRVDDAADPELFHGERYGNIKYVIPVPPGRYGVTIYSAETWFGPGAPAGGGAGSRVFDILSNGVVLRRGFDVFKEARGAGRPATFTAHGLEPDAQGKLIIALVPTRNYACVNAMEVIDESR
jgi:hypothetical protein